MKFFAIEQQSYGHAEYPTFLGVDDKQIVVGKSDRHTSFSIDNSTITIKSKDGGIVHTFVDGTASDGKTIREINTSKPLGKYLLWFIWIGTSNMTMLIQSIISYIKIGGFTGDIVVLTDQDDKPTELSKYQQVRFIKINAKSRLKKIIISRNNIFCLKPLIGEWMDVHNYDFMIYSDADILCVQPHLMPLLQSMNDKSVIWYSKDNANVSFKWVCTGFGLLTEEEITKRPDFSVNAGWFIVPNNEMGLSFLRTWSDMEKEREYDADDQGLLYAILIRGMFPHRLALGVVSAFNGYSWKPMQSESQIIHYYGHERYLQDIMAKEIAV